MGIRYTLPVTEDQLQELASLIQASGGTIKPHVLRGWDSFESVKRQITYLQAITPPGETIG